MTDRIEKILSVADEQESVELKIFKTAVIRTLKDYQTSPTKQNKLNLDSAKEGLNEKEKNLFEKYFKEETPGPSFTSMNEVVRHLTGAGYATSRSKISRDKSKGLIKTNPDGSILESEVRVYASTLKRAVADVGDLSDIHAIKAAREVEKLEEQIEKLRFDRKREEGLYLPKKEFESELAARAVVFEAGFRHLFNMKIQEWVTLVNGSQEKTADLLQNLNTALDDQLNMYASTDTFQVMFDGREE